MLAKDSTLLPSDPLGYQFCQIFTHPWNWIFTYDVENPHWQTETRYPLSPRNLWQYWQDAKQMIGVRFGASTRYAMIDIDWDSPYHPTNDEAKYEGIFQALEAIGIYRVLVIRSSESMGLHLYCPLPLSVKSFNLAIALKLALEDAGYQLGQGRLETFPNAKAYSPGKPSNYNAHRLPLQTGSLFLSREGEPIDGGLPRFLQAWENAAHCQDAELLEQSIAFARAKLNNIPRYRGTGSAARWKADDERVIREGWTGTGQTNELLKRLARYGVVWEKLSGQALIDYVHTRAIACPGYSQHCRHQHEIQRRSRDWAIEAERYYSPYHSEPPKEGGFHSQDRALNQHNSELSIDAQQRIKRAVQELVQEGGLPSRIRQRLEALMKRAKVAADTLYKYLCLWHPKHWDGSGSPHTEEVSADSIEAPNEGAKVLQFPVDRASQQTDPHPPPYEGGECGPGPKFLTSPRHPAAGPVTRVLHLVQKSPPPPPPPPPPWPSPPTVDGIRPNPPGRMPTTEGGP